MNRNILFITDRDTITSKTLRTGLISKGFTPIPTAAGYSSLPNPKDCPPVVFCCMQDWHIDRKYLYTEILGLVKESGALLFLGGDEELTEEDSPARVFRKEYVEEVFLRPFRVNEIAERIEKALAKKMKDPAFAKAYEAEEPTLQHTVLIVDDNPTSLRTLKNVLQDRFKVYMADSGVSALKFLDDRRPDLILLDYEMPVLSGPQFLAVMRERPALQKIPVIFLTGKSDRETVQEVVNLKPEGYLLKSTPTGDIVKKITEFFHDHDR